MSGRIEKKNMMFQCANHLEQFNSYFMQKSRKICFFLIVTVVICLGQSQAVNCDCLPQGSVTALGCNEEKLVIKTYFIEPLFHYFCSGAMRFII